MKTTLHRIGLILLILSIIHSCSDEEDASYYNLSNIPPDQGGEHIAVPEGTTDSPFGYYVYKPSFYNELADVVCPALIFLHGSGEKGSSLSNPEVLDKVLANGPPKMIVKGTWSPMYPMLVFSPQCSSGWNADKLKEFTEYILTNYKVNVQRIYLTGLSMGGYGTFSYIGKYAKESLIAAAVPICGGGNIKQAESFKTIPLWVFHGDADLTVSVDLSINMVEAINSIQPEFKAKLTIFPGVGHNSWDLTYTGSGMGKERADYDAFDQNIYDWMFKFKRSDLDSLIGYYR